MTYLFGSAQADRLAGCDLLMIVTITATLWYFWHVGKGMRRDMIRGRIERRRLARVAAAKAEYEQQFASSVDAVRDEVGR